MEVPQELRDAHKLDVGLGEIALHLFLVFVVLIGLVGRVVFVLRVGDKLDDWFRFVLLGWLGNGLVWFGFGWDGPSSWWLVDR